MTIDFHRHRPNPADLAGCRGLMIGGGIALVMMAGLIWLLWWAWS